MTIRIDRGSKIGDIQKQFNAYYPFLKIEFLRKNANARVKGMDVFMLPGEPVEALTGSWDNILINAGREQTVSELESELKKLFGIDGQVFRQSGNVWIETTLTDSWTLDKQNKEGEQISAFATGKKPVTNTSVVDYIGEQNQTGQETE